jgi:hypothetical protein
LNISNPSSPVYAGAYDMPVLSTYAQDLAVSGNYVYMVTASSGMRVIDKSNPSYPVEVGYYKYPPSISGHICISGAYAVAQSTSGILILQYTGGTISGDKRPNVLITNPKQGDIVSGNVNITFQTNDDIGIKESVVFIDNVFVTSVTLTQWTWNTSIVPAGIHKILLVSFDTSNQRAYSEIAVMVNSSMQDNPPAIAVQSPKNGDTVGANPSIIFNATDDVGFSRTEFHVKSVGILEGRIIDSTHGINSTRAVSPWVWDTSGLPVGQYTIEITISDTISQSSSTLITVTLNQELPVDISGTVTPIEAVIKPSEGKTQTTINYSVQSQSSGEALRVAIKIFNLRGVLIKTVIDRDMVAGSDTSAWDGRNFDNDVVASGSYLCYLYVNGKIKDTKKIVVIK